MRWALPSIRLRTARYLQRHRGHHARHGEVHPGGRVSEGTTEEQIVSGSLTGDFGRWGGRSPWQDRPTARSAQNGGRSCWSSRRTTNSRAAISTGRGASSRCSAIGLRRGGRLCRNQCAADRGPPLRRGPDDQCRLSLCVLQHSGAGDGIQIRSRMAADRRRAYSRSVRTCRPGTERARALHACGARNASIATDPCSISTTGECSERAQCRNEALNCPGGADNMTCNTETGGSVFLKPEKGLTMTFGIVLTPRFLDGFAATVDYFDIRVDGFVSTIDPLITLTECYGQNATQASESLYCPLVHRNAAGQLFGGGYVSNQNTNTGFLSTNGWDVQLDYSLNFEDWDIHGVGSVSLDLIGTASIRSCTEPAPGLGFLRLCRALRCHMRRACTALAASAARDVEHAVGRRRAFVCLAAHRLCQPRRQRGQSVLRFLAATTIGLATKFPSKPQFVRLSRHGSGLAAEKECGFARRREQHLRQGTSGRGQSEWHRLFVAGQQYQCLSGLLQFARPDDLYCCNAQGLRLAWRGPSCPTALIVQISRRRVRGSHENHSCLGVVPVKRSASTRSEGARLAGSCRKRAAYGAGTGTGAAACEYPLDDGRRSAPPRPGKPPDENTDPLRGADDHCGQYAPCAGQNDVGRQF